MMTEFGQQIKAAREQRGLALEDIAKSTRISLSYLRDIENGKFEFLPRPYVLAFTKTFANYVGLNGEEFTQQLKAALAPPAAEVMPVPTSGSVGATARAPMHAMHEAPAAQVNTEPSFPYLREVLIGLGIIILVIVSLFVVSNSEQDENAGATNAPAAQDVQEMSFEEMAKQVAAIADSQTKAEAVEPQILKLEAQVEAPVWMRVATDSAEAVATTFQRGTTAWQAKEKFILRVGNAGAVAFVLDGKNLGKVGESGQRIEVTITRDGFQEKRILPPPRPRVRADSSGT